MAYLARLAPGANLDHRGTTFDDALLTALLDALRDPVTARPLVGTARFQGTTFSDTAAFSRVTFSGDAKFDEATFSSDAVFRSATFSRTAGFVGAMFSHTATFGNAMFSGSARFGRATFSRTAGFGSAVFSDTALFPGAKFHGTARFGSVTFSKSAWFGRSTFCDTAVFSHATFSRDARFSRVTFSNSALFSRSTFSGAAGFDYVTFSESAKFSGVTFSSAAKFRGVKFSGDAKFDRVTFSGAAMFGRATFSDTVGFSGAKFSATSMLGPLVCTHSVDLSEAVFSAPVTIEAAAAAVVCRRTRWEATATLRLRYAEVDLTDAVFAQPLAVATHHEPFVEAGAADALLLGGNAHIARVTSLRGVDAAFLALTDTDLSRCRFVGAFHLDQIRLDGRTVFALPPGGTRWRWGLPQRWTRRRTLAEEHAWRALQHPPVTATAPATAEWWPGPDHPRQAVTPGPDDVAPLYRALRKAFEDSKNEPDAADFYYGEMEMRRRDVERPSAERGLLAAYWALSGYGLRAARALTWLAITMTATVLALMLWGLPTNDPSSLTTGIQAAPGQPVQLATDNPDPKLRSAYGDRITAKRAEKAGRIVLNSVVFRSSGQNLTRAGIYTEMLSRFFEPVLLALAVLAVRGRVKR